MGLRADKKLRTRLLIIENAIALFRERGIEAARVRDIAAASDVSEATFFNYFATRDALVSEWVHGQVTACFSEVEGSARAGTLRRTVRQAAQQLAHSLERERPLLGDLWRRARLVTDPDPSAPPSATTRCVAAAQEREEVRRDIPAEELGRLLEAALLSSAAGWLERADPSEPAAPALLRAVDLVLDGSRRRNERVRAPAASRPAHL